MDHWTNVFGNWCIISTGYTVPWDHVITLSCLLVWIISCLLCCQKHSCGETRQKIALVPVRGLLNGKDFNNVSTFFSMGRCFLASQKFAYPSMIVSLTSTWTFRKVQADIWNFRIYFYRTMGKLLMILLYFGFSWSTYSCTQ